MGESHRVGARVCLSPASLAGFGVTVAMASVGGLWGSPGGLLAQRIPPAPAQVPACPGRFPAMAGGPWGSPGTENRGAERDPRAAMAAFVPWGCRFLFFLVSTHGLVVERFVYPDRMSSASPLILQIILLQL